MYREVVHQQSLLSKKKSSNERFLIQEYAQRGEKPGRKLVHSEIIVGLLKTIERAEAITLKALNGRKLTIIEQKNLRENHNLDLVGWYISIQKLG